MFRRGKIAIIPIKGVITTEGAPILSLFPWRKVISSTEIIEFLEGVKRKPETKAVLLEINSPGGTSFPCKEIAEKIKEIDKPTLAWVRECVTSGAYWIASACKKIVADRLSRELLLLALFSLSIIFLSGCSYKLIPFSTASSKIAIPIFSNQTFKYGLEQTLTDSITNEFISDGRLQVVGSNEADLVLSGEIVSYLKGTPSEVTTTLEENRIRIEVLVSLVSKREKKTIKERKIEEVFVYSSSEVGGIQTEDEAVEEACKEIAEKLVDAITWDLGFSPI